MFGNYKDYLSRQSKYERMAEELDFTLNILGIQSVLDYGCAVGFMTKALNDLGYFCQGYDTSTWAVDYAKNVLKNENIHHWERLYVPGNKYDAIMALDVFEHMPTWEIRSLLNKIRSEYLIVRIPVCLEDETDFHLEVSRNDVTHVTCMSKTMWNALFFERNYKPVTLLNLKEIWDSPGVLAAIYKRM